MAEDRVERIRRLARESVLTVSWAEVIYNAAAGDERLLDVAARLAGAGVDPGHIQSWFWRIRLAREVPS